MALHAQLGIVLTPCIGSQRIGADLRALR